MVDRYYRKIEDVENDIENTMQISSMLLKLKGYDNKLDDLSKIGNNENNISSKLEKINDNSSSISTYLGQISTNTSSISSNSGKINDNASSISTNLGQISTNTSNIESNLEKITDIKSILQTSEILKKTYSIKNQPFTFTRNIIYFKLLETEIENNFNKDGKLEIDSDIYYRYNNLQNDHHRLQHEYRILDDKNNSLYKKILNKANTSDLNFDNNIMLVKDNFYVTFNNNYNKIKIILDLYRVYRHGTGNFYLELINENFVKVSYLDKNGISLEIDTNKNDISSNSSKITTNTGDISTNLEKINNITKTIMLKNIYFTDFDSKKEVLVRELLHFDNTTDRSRVATINYVNMEYNFKKDDFIEIDCKLMISHSSYDYAKNNLALYYDLYEGKNADQNKLLFRELRRYNQFPLIVGKDRIITYTKICYKVKYDTSNIAFIVSIQAQNKKVHLIVYHYIIQNGINYVSVKHYGKS